MKAVLRPRQAQRLGECRRGQGQTAGGGREGRKERPGERLLLLSAPSGKRLPDAILYVCVCEAQRRGRLGARRHFHFKKERNARYPFRTAAAPPKDGRRCVAAMDGVGGSRVLLVH